MNRYLFFFFIILFFPGVIFSQAITGFNLNYLYDQDAEVSFQIKPVRENNRILVFYKLECKRKEYTVKDYSIGWAKRTSVNDRGDEPLSIKDSVLSSAPESMTGFFVVDIPDKSWMAVAKLINNTTNSVWNFYAEIGNNWPVSFFLTENKFVVFSNFILTEKPYQIGNFQGKTLYGFLYKRKFEPAIPPFANSGNEERFLHADSVFSISSGEFFPKTPGLYLIQDDTVSAQGLAVFAGASPFPKYNKIDQLAAPLVYLTTSEEQVQLKNSGNDKTKFDKVILGITGSTERAKSFMRSYYQRVEWANRYFTNFKEGWRTDRGMIYIIFGPPTEVSRTTSNEIWYYKDTKTKYIFIKTGSVFSPANYFLQRDNRYTQEWYSTVDLWRKSRF